MRPPAGTTPTPPSSKRAPPGSPSSSSWFRSGGLRKLRLTRAPPRLAVTAVTLVARARTRLLYPSPRALPGAPPSATALGAPQSAGRTKSRRDPRHESFRWWHRSPRGASPSSRSTTEPSPSYETLLSNGAKLGTRSWRAKVCGVPRPAKCRVAPLRYRFALAEAATSIDDPDIAFAHAGAFFAPPSTWLLRPCSGPGAPLPLSCHHAARGFVRHRSLRPRASPRCFEADIAPISQSRPIRASESSRCRASRSVGERSKLPALRGSLT